MAKAQRPKRDEFELEELGEKLTEALESGNEIVLSVWKVEMPIQGRITKLDGSTRLVHVYHYGELKKIPFMDILSVERVG